MYQKHRLQLHQLRPGHYPFARARTISNRLQMKLVKISIHNSFGKEKIETGPRHWRARDQCSAHCSAHFPLRWATYGLVAISLMFISTDWWLLGPPRLHGTCAQWNGHHITKNLISFRFVQCFYFWNCARGRGDNGKRRDMRSNYVNLCVDLTGARSRPVLSHNAHAGCAECCCLVALVLFDFVFPLFFCAFCGVVARPAKLIKFYSFRFVVDVVVCLCFVARAWPMRIIVNSIHLVRASVPSRSLETRQMMSFRTMPSDGRQRQQYWRTNELWFANDRHHVQSLESICNLHAC